MEKTVATRQTGIDLLKITAMFMIVVIHILEHYGVKESVAVFSAQSAAVKLLLTMTAPAVNCYALCSGWLLIDRQIKPKRLVSLWLQVAFYSVSLTVLFLVLTRAGIVGANSLHVGMTDLFTAVTPISRGAWWYASCYFGLFLLMPVLNWVVRNARKEHLQIALVLGFLVGSLLTTITYGDGLGLKYGYSILWLAFLYVTGAYLKRYPIKKIKSRSCLLMYLGWVVACWLFGMLCDRVFMYRFTGQEKTSNLLNLYVSPVTVVSALLLFVGFVSIQRKFRSAKAIATVSALTFGIYLIHTQDSVWVYFDNCFAGLAQDHPVLLVCKTLLLGAGIFAACGVIERGRILLFQAIRADALADKIASIVKKWVCFLARLLGKLEA